MESFSFKWGILALLLNCMHFFSLAQPDPLHIQAVNLGGWLVVEGFLTPELFKNIPNKNMLDGTKVQFRSLALDKYVVAENGGGSVVTVRTDSAKPDTWETFRLWRISENQFQFRTFQDQFLLCDEEGTVSAKATSSDASIFEILTANNGNLANHRIVHIKYVNTGTYIQAIDQNTLTAKSTEEPGWDDNNTATFEMIILKGSKIKGEFQLANGYEPDQAEAVLQKHRNEFVTEQDFNDMAMHNINTVRIPVGWWIIFDFKPDPDLDLDLGIVGIDLGLGLGLGLGREQTAPYVRGSLEALDNAFIWAQNNGIKCIIDLHAAPGGQSKEAHSGTRDGSVEWHTSTQNQNTTLAVLGYLAKRYGNNQALLGIELLNEPNGTLINLPFLVPFYTSGYNVVNRYAPTAYVIICQRIGGGPDKELFDEFIMKDYKQFYPKLVVDLHWYTIFDDRFKGEWTNEMHHDANANASDYKDFGEKQLRFFGEASFGWGFWTLKSSDPKFKHWDFKWNVDNGYLLPGGTTNK